MSPYELQRFFGVRPHGVLHVGAHHGEEALEYLHLNWQGDRRIYWIEADPDLSENLKRNLNPTIHQVICAAAWHEDGVTAEFIRTNSSQSSSLLELNQHKILFPEIHEISRVKVTTRRIDSLLSLNDKFTFINLDIQGSELSALIGAGKLLDQVNYVYCEINAKELYTGGGLLPELDLFLRQRGFTRIITRWASPDAHWGDALFVRTDRLPKFLRLRRYLFIFNRARKLRHPIAIKNLFFGEIQ